MWYLLLLLYIFPDALITFVLHTFKQFNSYTIYSCSFPIFNCFTDLSISSSDDGSVLISTPPYKLPCSPSRSRMLASDELQGSALGQNVPSILPEPLSATGELTTNAVLTTCIIGFPYSLTIFIPCFLDASSNYWASSFQNFCLCSLCDFFTTLYNTFTLSTFPAVLACLYFSCNVLVSLLI